MAPLLTLTLCLTTVYGCGDGAVDLPSNLIPETQYIHLEQTFTFSISPNDRWMLFYQRKPEVSVSTAMSQPHLLCLKTNCLYSRDLPEGLEAPLVGGTSRWSADSRHYLYGYAAFVFEDDKEPNLITGFERIRTRRVGEPERWRVPEEDVILSVAGYCSDCYEGVTDTEIIESVLGSEYALRPKSMVEHVVSPTGEKVYYQKGRHTSSVSLYERSHENGEDRRLAIHRGRCIRANYLRLSPDGRYLAYHIATGCQWVDPARLYIVDVQEGTLWRVGQDVFEDVFYLMHWSSDSARLYYAGRNAADRVSYVAYVDMPTDDDGKDDEQNKGKTDLPPHTE